MIDPTLTPSERAAVRAAKKMERVDLSNGHVVATDGHRTLFAAGTSESFAPLWAQALAARGEVTNGE